MHIKALVLRSLAALTPDQTVLAPASMMGDRAFVIFAARHEISAFIESRC